ncbi:putative alcohol dehydrogenase [Ophiobolus disseminans]|uniref:Putative alcohol dehydrogenase n=1 Tax=Ophiobolus disseminans TaxID=1469910 RepID=A0A6A6ZED0_9PLEO|nr:putative alcohol dehydrogenase [Ophiobolus disseminans]
MATAAVQSATSAFHQIPHTQTAIIASEAGDFEISSTVAVPKPDPDEVLIKTKAVGLNPVDTKLVGEFVTAGCVFGFDCAGIVVAVGSEVTGLRVGDRVCGSASGMNKLKPLGGAFAHYVTLPGNMALKVPPSMSMEQAASMGTAIASACMTMFWSLGMDPAILTAESSADGAPKEATNVLVYGGSTCTGTMMIQLLRICGFHVLTTCSPRNFDLVREYGAHETFDYKTSDCAARIRAHCGNALGLAIDCVSEDSTMKFCYEAIGRGGGKYTALNPFNGQLATRRVVEPDWILATRITGGASAWPGPYASEPEPRLREMAVPIFAVIERLLLEGKIRPHPVRVESGGYEGLIRGVSIIRKGELSGQKLVYNL